MSSPMLRSKYTVFENFFLIKRSKSSEAEQYIFSSLLYYLVPVKDPTRIHYGSNNYNNNNFS